MNVKKSEELLMKVAYNVINGKMDKKFLLRAAIQYAKSKSKAADRRDLWKIRKRLKQGESNEE